ncbi:protein of unknown function [Shimia gijangensis]|uniref:DnaJ homologue subfamily C member 28 conserved domain-containing protein n=1 Tax=Shimia gijangensis TaxID=1470563 RepID=A0A1M6H0A6_9RHOB|nr:DnaJ family domain-containing protein [Shimia gijangensis]SHJ15605.1 protein of unknown function [Shimia gijangensis]
MRRSFKNLLERQIKKAEAEGQLSNLEGAGSPLPQRHALEDPATAAGQRIMAQAGVLLREFSLKYQLDKSRKVYQSCTDETERKQLMAKLADLQMRYEMEREAYRKFLG